MAAPNDAVFHRRNKQIQDAIDAQNLKQALQLCERRLKKGEDSRFLRAWKAQILFRHSDEGHHQRGLEEILELCNLDPPTTDLEALEILHQTLRGVDSHETTIHALWEKAAKVKPRDHEVQMRWFTYAFEDGHWKSAQKAAMSLKSSFPNRREYHIWATFLCYLITLDPFASDADRRLFGALAYRMISKAADDVPADPVGTHFLLTAFDSASLGLTNAWGPVQNQLLSPPRAIQTAEELLLLIKIFESRGLHTETVHILNSKNLGIRSRIAQNDWSFVRAKLISLEKAEMWNEGLGFVRNMLTLPEDDAAAQATIRERDDWVVWNLMVLATQKIGDPGTIEETQKFLEKFVLRHPELRNAQLALLELTSWRTQAGILRVEDLEFACEAYYDRNRDKLYCFTDLRKHVVLLENDALLKFLKHVWSNVEDHGNEVETSNPFRGIAKINAFKLEYSFRLFLGDHDPRHQIEDFVSRCLQAYREAQRPSQGSSPSTIESHPSDDLCLLAAMSLIRASDHSDRSHQSKAPSSILIRAASILERLLLDSPHNYHGLLLLVRIYLLLGAGSLALKTFGKLSVKQMQYETVAHNLFTRLATIHPLPAPPYDGVEPKDFNPQSALIQALKFYRNANATSTKSRMNGLINGSYLNVEGSIGFQDLLRRSICRKMWALDVRRIQRFVGGDLGDRYDELAADISTLIDERSFTPFMNCESPQRSTFEEQMRLGPLPKERWVKSAMVTDKLFYVLKAMLAQKPVNLEPDLPSIEELIAPGPECDMTPTEIDNLKVHHALLKVTFLLNSPGPIKKEELDELLLHIEDWLTSVSQSLSSETDGAYPAFNDTTLRLRSGKFILPSWLYFHNSFSVLETIKAISLVLSVFSKKSPKSAIKIPKDSANRLATLHHQIYENIKANSRTLKSQISQPGILGALIDLILTDEANDESDQLCVELENTLDMAALEVFCGGLMESWEEGLEGIFAVVIQ